VIEENAIQVHVSALRKVLDDGNVGLSLLATVAGRGYRLAGSMQKTTAGNPDVGDAFHGKPSIRQPER
jgi:DNA-binding winged helix-turn-helix (wHTH) protein